MKNHYLEVLNLEAGATERDIKRAYRRLAKQYHPDRSALPDAEVRFIEIAEAYRFLTEVGPAPHQEPVRYDYDPFASEYERRRQEAREFARQRAAERYRQQVIATKEVNRVLRIIISLVALFELLLVIDIQLSPMVSPDHVEAISFGHFHMTGQYEKVILQRYVLHADYGNVARIEPGSVVTVAATPILNTVRWINVGIAPYQHRIYPAYSIYQGYRFMISLILILCAIFALFPIRSDNKAVTGAVALLFFAFQLALL